MQPSPKLFAELRFQEIFGLYGGIGIEDMPGKGPLERASNASSNFIRYHFHAAPFDRRVLSGLWNRCTDKRCDGPRHRFEAMTGPLDRDAPPPRRRGAARRKAR